MKQILEEISKATAGYLPNLLGALAILFIGLILALVAAALVRGLLSKTKLDMKIAKWTTEKETGESCNVASGAGKVTFWFIMVIVLVAFFEALRLTLVTDPLNRLVSQVFQFLPQLFGAVILLLLAWVLASLLRRIITKAMGVAKLDEKVGGQTETEKEPGVSLSKTIGDVAYWFIFLLFLPAILGALNLQGLLEPVQRMMDKFLGFLPNLIAAAVIGTVGWFVARVVKQIVTSLLAAAGADKVSDRVGIKPLSKLVGLICYILVLIPVIIAALEALALEAVTSPASRMLDVILGAVPVIFAAVLLLTIAYVVARVVAGLITDLLTGMGFNAVLMRLGIGKEPTQDRKTPSEIVGYLTLVAIMLFAIFEASDLLGFGALSSMIEELTALGGRIILGVIILGIGLYLANLASKTILSSNAVQAAVLALVARMAILVLSASIAIRHMGVANEIISLAFGLTLGATAVALAVAFGIGGRKIAAQKLEEWFGSKESTKP